MSKSIIQSEKECIVCRTTLNLEEHHCIYGTANRKNSEKYGLKVWLCHNHHTGNQGVHNGNVLLDTYLKKLAQKKFEEKYDHKTYMQIFRRNFLWKNLTKDKLNYTNT